MIGSVSSGYGQAALLPERYVDSLLDLASSDTISLYTRADHGKKALEIAKSINYVDGVFKANMATGIVYLTLSEYNKTLEYFQDGYLQTMDHDSLRYRAFAAYYMGTVSSQLENLDRAKAFYQESLDLYSQMQDSLWMGILKNGMAIIYTKEREMDEALRSYQEALEIFESNDMVRQSALAIGNIGDHYLELEQPNRAIPYFQKSLKITRAYNDRRGVAYDLANLGLANRMLDNYPEALNYFHQSLAVADANHYNNVVCDMYKDIYLTHKAKGNIDSSLIYFEQYHELQDSIFNQVKNARIGELQVLYENEMTKRELLESREEYAKLAQRSRFTRILTVIAIAILALFILIAYLIYSRNKVQQDLVKAELKNRRLESESLKKELEDKQKDLTNFALDIARKNEFSNRVLVGLKEMVDTTPTQSKTKAKELLMLTSQHLKINEDIKEFQMNVERVNSDFFSKLNNSFPDLTPSEKHLCGLIRLNLSTKDIAAIRNISPKSVEMGRYRLRKKLGLDPKEEITTFLQNL
jgi:tetratricopeptide (TPR) repeat protein